MKYLLKSSMLGLIIGIASAISCGESEDPSLRELLAGNHEDGKSWKITAIEVELGTLQPYECVRDNNITYFPNGRYEVNEGETKCDPYDPPAYIGTWLYDDKLNKLSIKISDSSKLYTIDYLDEFTQRITSTFIDGERTYVLKKQ